MNTPAIHQAIRLEKHPEELAWLCFPDSDLPDGVNDLLRLCASSEQLNEFADKNDLNPKELDKALFNFIETVMLNDKNSDEKILGIDKFASTQVQKFHYQLLIKAYHPDTSTRSDSEAYATLITKAYQNIKEKTAEQEAISFSENRKPSRKYYEASKRAETHNSMAKTAIAVISTITIFTLVAMVGKLSNKSNTELVISTNQESTILSGTKAKAQKIVQVTSLQSNLNTELKNTEANKEIATVTNSAMQTLLKRLELAYEKGDVETIKPILANTPEIKDQTEKQLNEKLETLFEITSERKMVLFDFNWVNNSGVIQGEGKFISRYQLIGEENPLTREGNALVTAEKVDDKLKITQLLLENQYVE